MSMADQIRDRVAGLEGHQLFHLPPLMPGEQAHREMYVSKEVLDAVERLSGNGYVAQRHFAFRAALDAFTCGYTLAVGENPHDKGAEAQVARVAPVSDDIWDLRCIAPTPGIRCLGAFGWKDCFIALTWEYREDIVWSTAVKDCKREWDRLFRPIKRYRRKDLDGYLTDFYPV